MKTLLGTSGYPASVAAADQDQPGLLKVLLAGETAFDHADGSSVACKFVDERGALAIAERAIGHLPRQHVRSRPQPGSRVVAGHAIGRLREWQVLKNEHDDA